MGHAATVGARGNSYKLLVGSLKGRCHSDCLALNGRIILKQILKKYEYILWMLSGPFWVTNMFSDWLL
jgi:hypothetical protein